MMSNQREDRERDVFDRDTAQQKYVALLLPLLEDKETRG
jgi:hypothetical protein